MKSEISVHAVLVGRARPFGPRGEPSGIDKRALTGRVRLTLTGLQGDEQGDCRHHGGTEKAIHLYPADHYASWRTEQPELEPMLRTVGAFGENLSTAGWTERDVCVGDICTLGTARIQVSQGRQPCWKLNVRFDRKDMASLVQASGRTGWYYRVLEEGYVESGDVLAVVERPHSDWTLSRIQDLMYRDTLNRTALEGLAALEYLSSSWRQLARRRLERHEVEDFSGRVETP